MLMKRIMIIFVITIFIYSCKNKLVDTQWENTLNKYEIERLMYCISEKDSFDVKYKQFTEWLKDDKFTFHFYHESIGRYDYYNYENQKISYFNFKKGLGVTKFLIIKFYTNNRLSIEKKNENNKNEKYFLIYNYKNGIIEIFISDKAKEPAYKAEIIKDSMNLYDSQSGEIIAILLQSK